LGVSRYYYAPELTEEMIVELLDVEATIRNIKRVELLKQFIIDLK
jgi:hypothetical protein